MIKHEVLAHVLAAEQQEGAQAVTLATARGPVSAGDPKVLAAMAVEKHLKREAAGIPDDVDLTTAHFGELSAALLRSIDKVNPDSRVVIATHGIGNMMQHRLKGLELAHAVEGPGLLERLGAMASKFKERLGL